MWIRPDFSGSVEDVRKEVTEALAKFEEAKANGTLVSVDENDPKTWL